MTSPNGRLTILPLHEWPEDRVRKAWRLLSITVHRYNQAPASLPGRDALLADAEADAALFGEELVRRGLI